MTSNQEQATQIKEKGRQFLTLIRDSGGDGIMRKGLTDAFKRQLNEDDHTQLDLLAAQGFITVGRVSLVDHPNVEYVYRAGSRHD